MNLSSLIKRFRVQSGDSSIPPRWPDSAVKEWMNEAEQQACIRGRLIYEDDNDSVCVIELHSSEKTYKLHPKITEIVSLHIVDSAGDHRELPIKSREWLNANHPDWRQSTDPAWAAIQSDTSLRIVGAIVADDELRIECYRMPLEDMGDAGDAPEIHEAHHAHLIDWVLYQAFQEQDAEWYDANRSATHEAKFVRHFGHAQDSDMRRLTRADSVQHNEPYIF